ncbi:MAG: hypothetical protein ACTSUE_27510 [Promethearchaeota archaeon]
MASPEDIERAEQLAFSFLQIPAAIWSGSKSAFTQMMPLTTQTYADTFVFMRLYAIVGVLIYLILFGDATVKLLRQYRLMLLGRLRPWKCIRRFMGFTEIRTDPDAEHDDVIIVNVPLTGFASQIILMFLVDMSLALFLSIFWVFWLFPMFIMMLVSLKQPQSYYQHMQSVRGRYEGVPRVSKVPTTVYYDYEEDDMSVEEITEEKKDVSGDEAFVDLEEEEEEEEQ